MKVVVCYAASGLKLTARVSREKTGKCYDTQDVGCAFIIGLGTVCLVNL